jgi:hypothetical protein
LMWGSFPKIQPLAHGLTYATMHQGPHEFIVDTSWKTAPPKLGWKK